jgi:hypothetical protein
MQGPSIGDSALKGVIPRVVDGIFTAVGAAPDTIEFTVTVSFVEIYLERIRDLLEPVSTNLQIRASAARGIFIDGVAEEPVASPADMMAAYERGTGNRAVSATGMNAGSSRSHSVVVITISQKNVDTQSVKSGRLYLVDLAGSEMIGKTGVSGQQVCACVRACACVCDAFESWCALYGCGVLVRVSVLVYNKRWGLGIRSSYGMCVRAWRFCISSLAFGVRANGRALTARARAHAYVCVCVCLCVCVCVCVCVRGAARGSKNDQQVP